MIPTLLPRSGILYNFVYRRVNSRFHILLLVEPLVSIVRGNSTSLNNHFNFPSFSFEREVVVECAESEMWLNIISWIIVHWLVVIDFRLIFIPTSAKLGKLFRSSSHSFLFHWDVWARTTPDVLNTEVNESHLRCVMRVCELIEYDLATYYHHQRNVMTTSTQQHAAPRVGRGESNMSVSDIITTTNGNSETSKSQRTQCVLGLRWRCCCCYYYCYRCQCVCVLYLHRLNWLPAHKTANGVRRSSYVRVCVCRCWWMKIVKIKHMCVRRWWQSQSQ